MSATIFAPNRQYKSKNLRGLLEYARKSRPVAVSLEARICPTTGAPYFMRIDFANGAKGFAHWQDWRIAADWIAARRSWLGPAIADDCTHGDFIARLRAHYLQRDGRYSVRREFVGMEQAQWVVRFCGDFVGHAPTATDAWHLARQFDDKREAEARA